MSDQQSKISTSSVNGATSPDEGEVLEWTCHKAKRRPMITLGVTALILLFGIFVYLMTDYSTTFTAFALVVLFLSLARFYLPIKYRLTDKGITIKSLTQALTREWKVYRTCYPDRNGILLSPFTRPTRLENFRGVFLLFENNADEVTDFVKRHLNRNTELASGSNAKGQS
jgi:hypothetical protein